MNVPNVICKIRYFENEDTLSHDASKCEKYGDARKFYSCNQSNGEDYLKYINKGSKQKLDYVEYSGNSEKSTGVFGKNGLLSAKERQELRRNLRATKSVIWDCLLTFQPEFGQKYCNEYGQAYDLMRKEFPRFMKDAGLDPNNVIWYAGLHTNKNHRHIHISFFENKPTRIRAHKKELQFSHGKIPMPCVNRFKMRAELALTDITAELKIARQEVTAVSQQVLWSKDSLIRFNNDFQSLIIKLIDKLPADGRLSYASENMQSLRPIIKQIVDCTIKSNAKWYKAFTTFCTQVQKRDIEICTMLSRNHIPKTKWNRYLKADTYLEDMYRRLGNQIINYARVYKKRESKARGRLALKRIRQKTTMNLLLKSAEMKAAMEADSMYFFREYLNKLENAREDNTIMEDLYEME